MATPEQPEIFHDPVVFRFGKYFHCTLSQLRYVAFTSIGIALLWPWNCYLSASAYYGDRFTMTPSLQRAYPSTFMSVSTITTMAYTFLLSQIQGGVKYVSRIKYGLIITIVIFIAMAISCVSDFFISMNDYVFFVLLMLMVLASAMATALSQNGTMATVNVLGSIYTNAVMVGQAIAGALPSIALIVSLLIAGEKRPSREAKAEVPSPVEKNYGLFVYFITASLVSILSMGLLELTNYYSSKAAYTAVSTGAEEVLEEEASMVTPVVTGEQPGTAQKNFVPFLYLWGKLRLIVSTIFITFCVTLAFPVFASTVTSVHENSTHRFFLKSIYIPFVYLVWNIGDLAGRALCGLSNSVMLVKLPKFLIGYAVARLIFIPLFMTCNIHPNTSSALVPSDFWYILLQFLFGLSNGQLCTSCFMVVGDYCDDDDEKEAAGGFTTIFLTSGLAAGSLLSYLLVPFVG